VPGIGATKRRDSGRSRLNASPSFARTQRMKEYLLQRRIVALREAGLRRPNHPFLIKAFPGEVMACGSPELANELPLRSPVALPEGVDGINLAQVVSRSMSPVRDRQVLQSVLFRELGKQCVKPLFQVLRQRKQSTRLGDPHGSKLSGPGIDVLKEMSMDGLQVGRIEVSAQLPML